MKTVWRTPEGFTIPWANWNSIEPSSPGYEDCATRYYDNERIGKWNDAGCNGHYQYYCEDEVQVPNEGQDQDEVQGEVEGQGQGRCLTALVSHLYFLEKNICSLCLL